MDANRPCLRPRRLAFAPVSVNAFSQLPRPLQILSSPQTSGLLAALALENISEVNSHESHTSVPRKQSYSCPPRFTTPFRTNLPSTAEPPILSYAHYVKMDEDLQKYIDHHFERGDDQTMEAYYDWRRQVLDFDIAGQLLIIYSHWTKDMAEEARENGNDERARSYEGLNRDVMWRDLKDMAEEQEAVYGADACWEAELEEGLGDEEVDESVRLGQKRHAEVYKEDDED